MADVIIPTTFISIIVGYMARSIFKPINRVHPM